MSNIPPYFFTLPATFDPGEYFGWDSTKGMREDASYFISLILMKIAQGRASKDGVVRLMAKYLRKVMHKHKYAAVIQALFEGGAVLRKAYQTGVRSFGYGLAERYRGDTHVRVPATDSRIIKRLDAYQREQQANQLARMLPVHHALARHQQALEIDIDVANKILRGLPKMSNPYDVQGILVRNIHERQFRIGVGKYGRVSNNITNLRRELRGSLRHRGKPLWHADIACCQPALLARRIARERGEASRAKQSGSIYDAPTNDIDEFCNLVQNGLLYDFVLEGIKNGACPKMTREGVKRKLLTDVIAKSWANSSGAEYPSVVEGWFRIHFPTVYRYIRDVNKDGSQHCNLIRILQREESRFVIETIAAELSESYPQVFLMTLHDAIYTTEENIPLVEASFKKAFEASHFPMLLKISR